ncbi:MAG: DUF4296 domain-containing protein [Saprospiraceae bacterium]
MFKIEFKARPVFRFFSKNRLLIFAALLFLHVGCGEQTEVQEPTLSDEKVARIMADLQLAESATTGLVGLPKDSLAALYFDQVFKLHHVSQEQYEADLKILTNDVDRFEAILNNARDMLEPPSEVKQDTTGK